MPTLEPVPAGSLSVVRLDRTAYLSVDVQTFYCREETACRWAVNRRTVVSADNISVCPSCRQWTLREYRDIGITQDHETFTFTVNFTAICRECDWEWGYTVPPVVVGDVIVRGKRS